MTDERSPEENHLRSDSDTRARLVEAVQEMQSRLEVSEELLRSFDDSGSPADNEFAATVLMIHNNEILMGSILDSVANFLPPTATSFSETEEIGQKEPPRLG